MRKDREQAVVLRQAGMSYSDIRDRMGVPLSTLSSWFRGQNWSNNIATENAQKARNSSAIRFAVLNTVRGSRLKKIYEDAKQDAYVDFQELKYHPLFIAAITLYWSHGDKQSGRVSFSSGDPRAVRIFRLFLRRLCENAGIRAQLMIPSENRVEEPKYREFWTQSAGIREAEYIKTVFIKRNKRSNKPYNGICNILVNSAYLKHKILRWIELLAEDIGQEKYIVDNAGIV